MTHAIPWRAVELAVIDSLRQVGCKVIETGGIAYLVAEVFDENSGQLVDTVRVLSIEQFSRTLANNW
jgi:hypothetical protein